MRHLLIDARQEILDLRRRNELLAAQMGVVEVFAAALGLRRDAGGASPDVAWALQRKIDELANALTIVPETRTDEGGGG